MKKRIVTTTLALTLALILLASCGGKTDGENETETNTSAVTDTKLPETDVYGDTVETNTVTAIRIDGADISEFTVVCADNGDETKLISDYVIENVKSVSGVELKAKDAASADGRMITIESVDGDGDGFEVKIENGNIHITYSAVDGAYKAVATTLGDSLFDISTAENGVIELENGFVVSGKCSDHVIGDNEFDPFS